MAAFSRTPFARRRRRCSFFRCSLSFFSCSLRPTSSPSHSPSPLDDVHTSHRPPRARITSIPSLDVNNPHSTSRYRHRVRRILPPCDARAGEEVDVRPVTCTLSVGSVVGSDVHRIGRSFSSPSSRCRSSRSLLMNKRFRRWLSSRSFWMLRRWGTTSGLGRGADACRPPRRVQEAVSALPLSFFLFTKLFTHTLPLSTL
jgi:hypothetical protein